MPRPDKIISGGQSGVDRGALDAAIKLGIDQGGWCPPGRKAEGGPIPERYHLDEVPVELFAENGGDYNDPSDHYRVRTRLNIKDADATLVLTENRMNLTPGTRLTVSLAREMQKPCIILNPNDDDAPWRIGTWIRDQEIHVLNVAGPRESRAPGIEAKTCEILSRAFTEIG